VKRTIEFDDQDLGQFAPQVAEALLRIARQQAPKPKVPKPHGFKVLRQTDETEQRARLASQRRADGSAIPPNLLEGPIQAPWR
jgi:hypothetical protein